MKWRLGQVPYGSLRTALACAMLIALAACSAPAAPEPEPTAAPPTPAYAPTLSILKPLGQINTGAYMLRQLVQYHSAEVTVSAASIDSLTLHMVSRSSTDEEVLVPAGTYFMAADQATQNMVVRHTYRGVLPAGGTLDATLDVACANLHRAEPTSKDTFTLLFYPLQPELRKLADKLDSAGAGYPAEQAAVWIVTDNATFDQLGMLVRYGRAGPAVIDADEAVRALQIVEQAGLRLEDYAIWWERDSLATALSAPDLKDWLVGRAAQTQPGQEISQFADSASASSEDSSSGGSARWATGQPNAVDCQEWGAAWASAPEQTDATLLLIYKKPVIPSRITIYQSLHAGAVALVEMVDIVGNRHVVYQGKPAAVSECPYKMVIDVTDVKAPALYVEVTVQQEGIGPSRIDAVELVGREP